MFDEREIWSFTRKRLSVGGAKPGESVNGRRVNSSAKLLVSISSFILGLIGAGRRLCAMASQSRSAPKNGWRFTSSKPLAPRRRLGFFVKSLRIKSLAIFEIWFGINGWFFIIRLERNMVIVVPFFRWWKLSEHVKLKNRDYSTVSSDQKLRLIRRDFFVWINIGPSRCPVSTLCRSKSET